MEQESVSAFEADPIIISEDQGDEGQVETPPAEADAEETKRTEASKRREREKATRARLQTERDDALARASKLEVERDRLKKQASEIQQPNDNDYSDPFDLVSAKTGAVVERRIIERNAETADSAVAEAQREVQAITAREQAAIEQSWAAQREDAKQRYADFDEVARSDGFPVNKTMADLIMTSDIGADVLYHLGQNHAKAVQIARLSPVEAAREIGRIEATITQPKPRTQTTAPDPITPVKGAAGVSTSTEKMSFMQFKAHREAGGKL